MPNVRGVAVLNAIRFVTEIYGAPRHDQVVAALPAPRHGTFVGAIREASWKPLEDFVAYMETAKSQLGPHEPDFYRRLGRFAGHLERARSNVGLMVVDPGTALRMGPLVWRSFHDSGRLEVEVLGPHEGIARVFDYPASRAMCERRCGAWEGLLSSEELPASVEETACMLDGHGCCETHVIWGTGLSAP